MLEWMREFLADGEALLIAACVFISVVLFIWTGVRLFARGWAGYEERYITGAEKTLDSIYLTIPPQHVVYLSVVCFVVLGLLCAWLFGNLLVGLAFGTPGLLAPKLLLWYLKRRRDRRFDEQLVDMLLNMGNSLKAGFSLPQSLELIAREMDNPMGQEVRLVVQEMRLGVPMEEALGHLYDRMPSQDLDLIVTSILISRDVGGNLTEVFDNIAYTIRERHRIEGKIRALSAQGKLQGFVICCIPPAIAVALHYFAPRVIEPLFTEVLGWATMAVIVVLMAIGIRWIYKIVAIEV
jgi:tight adherence protein B